ncbi:uncharacterized protein [Littorina saxatilis]|uniref:uncharacterized protein n=1 Tax=Littorina saxatilis TaxID=31220 RepID=UPI0038B64172
MSLGFVIFIVVGLSISYSRHQRIQRRLHRSTLFRRNQGRTDHFRKHKPPPRTPSMEKNGRPGRGDLLRSYLRALVFIAYDRTEIETEEEEKRIAKLAPNNTREKNLPGVLSCTRRSFSKQSRRGGSKCYRRRSSSVPSGDNVAVPSVSGTCIKSRASTETRGRHLYARQSRARSSSLGPWL